MVLLCHPSSGEVEAGTHWLASLACLVSSEPVKDPISCPSDNQACPLIPTCMSTHKWLQPLVNIYTPSHEHMYTQRFDVDPFFTAFVFGRNLRKPKLAR